MATSESAIQQRLLFAPNDFHDPDSFFFLHTINILDATLRIQVLGPNLSFTFRHRKVPGGLSTVDLTRKTAGFLVLVEGNLAETPRRNIITWAESGHGLGGLGDLLLPDPFVLSNRFCATRAMNMSKLLGFKHDHPWDHGRSGLFREDRRGCFYAAHVEAKLATHAVHVLLSVFQIPHNPHRLTRRTLRRLSSCRWESGHKPVVEVYVSRRNCPRCGTFMSKLQAVTGVAFRLVWRPRLVRMEFKNEMAQVDAAGRDAMPSDEEEEEEEIVVDEGIDIDSPVEILSDEEDDDVAILDLVDLTGSTSTAAALARPAQPPPREVVDLTKVDDYINGLAYCVGQFEASPRNAIRAILELAARLRHQHQATRPRRPVPIPKRPADPPRPRGRHHDPIPIRTQSPSSTVPEFLRSPPPSPTQREISARNARLRRGRGE